eukprot:5760333-Prymnesium_polylepis.1
MCCRGVYSGSGTISRAQLDEERAQLMAQFEVTRLSSEELEMRKKEAIASRVMHRAQPPARHATRGRQRETIMPATLPDP